MINLLKRWKAKKILIKNSNKYNNFIKMNFKKKNKSFTIFIQNLI